MKKEYVPQLGFDFGDAHLPSSQYVIFNAYDDYWAKIFDTDNWIGNIAFLKIEDYELKQLITLKSSEINCRIIDLDNTSDLKLLEIFYDAEKNNIISLLIGADRDIAQADLKSRFDNCMRINLPKISNDKFIEIFNIWAVPRGIKMDKKDLLHIKTALSVDIVTIFKFLNIIDELFRVPTTIKSKDIGDIIDFYEAKFLSEDFFQNL